MACRLKTNNEDLWRKLVRPAVVIALVAAAGAAHAQVVDLATERDFKGYVQLGANYTDNFYYSPNPGRGVAGLQLLSNLAYTYSLPRFRFGAAGGFQAAGFNIANGDDSYVDGHLNLGADWKSAERHSFSYLVSGVFGHDPYGTERTAGGTLVNSPLDHWRLLSMGGKYDYGTLNDPFNIQLRVDGITKRYTTNTAATQFIDYTALIAGTTLLYNYSPKTAFLLDLSGNRTNYDLSPALNSTEYRALTGVRWTATAKTSADLRVGYFRHTPKTGSGFEQVSSVDWQANAKWAPLSTRVFTLQAGRSSIPSYLVAVSFINNQEINATWREDWTSNLTTKLITGYAIQEFRQSTRRDQGLSSNLSTEYKLAESASLVNDLGYSFRHSNTASVEFNRFSAYLGLRVMF